MRSRLLIVIIIGSIIFLGLITNFSRCSNKYESHIPDSLKIFDLKYENDYRLDQVCSLKVCDYSMRMVPDFISKFDNLKYIYFCKELNIDYADMFAKISLLPHLTEIELRN